MNEIAKNIRKIAKMQPVIVCGNVQQVNEGEMNCIVDIDTEGETIIASLVVGEKQNAIIQVPKIGSMVAVAMVSNISGFVIMNEENEKIIINGGKNGGLINIEEIKKQLNIMSNRIDTIINAIKNATPVAQDGGASMKTSMVARLNTIQEKENFDSMEDERVKH